MLSENEIDGLTATNDKSLIFKEISEKLAEKNDNAKEIRSLIEAHEIQLASLKNDLRKIEEDDMPALMDELGITKVCLTNGKWISVDTSLHVSIPVTAKPEAHQWLRDKGIDIIKNELKIKFNRSEDNYVGEVKEVVEKLGLHYEQKEEVHNQTLKATVKEQMKQGLEFPAHLFDIFIKRLVNTK